MSSSAAKPELRPGSLIAGKFRLQKQLGRGAAGVVWSAVNVATSRQVALKLLLRPEPKARERLEREARAAGALKHPNVVDVYDVIRADDGSPALVLELLEGQTLQQLLTERAPLPQLEAAGIARDVARALSIAHASGIVHRDLKPANIFLHSPGDDAPIVKVVDFGISKNLLTSEGTLTETGMAVGSPSFMSPEQVRGERRVDGRTDLWALGVILYEMLTGNRLFDGRAHEVLTHVLVQPIPSLAELVPGLDPEIQAIVYGLLERDVKKRLGSAEEVAERLGALTNVAGERLRTEPPPTTRRLLNEFPMPAPAPAVPRPMAKGAAAKPPAAVAKAPTSASKVPAAAAKAPAAVSKPPAPAKAAVGAKAPITVPKAQVAVPKPPQEATAKAPDAAKPSEPPRTVPAAAIPKIHQDEEEEDEPTHVAPMAMRRALAQKTVPAVYADEEEEQDRTRVAADAELTAAIFATREPAPATSPKPAGGRGDSDQNSVPTVRPPPGEMSSEEIAIMAENATSEDAPVTLPSAEGGDGEQDEEQEEGEQGAAEEEAQAEAPFTAGAAADQASEEEAAAPSEGAPDALAESPPEETAPVQRSNQLTVWIVAAVVLVLVIVAVVLLVQQQ